MTRFTLMDAPLLGESLDGRKLYLGGFSGLHFLGTDAETGRMHFVTHTDRGPNGAERALSAAVTARPFLLPRFQPRLVYLILDPNTKVARIEREVLLTGPAGSPLTGLPNGANDELPTDTSGMALRREPTGLDLEGIARAGDGSFWLADEYGPSLAHFSADGKWLDRITPQNGLPAELASRRLNRGFEGVAIAGTMLYAILQSPLAPGGEKGGRAIRIVAYDLALRRTVGQYLYLPECESCEKIGDLAALGPGELLVLEHDGKRGPSSYKRVFRVTVAGATNLQGMAPSEDVTRALVDRLTGQELEKRGIKTVAKTEVVDLTALGIDYTDKPEGLTPVSVESIAVLNDNDFNVDPAHPAGTYIEIIR